MRRPNLSAMTPVGTSNRTMPAVKQALAVNTSATVSPASRRNSVSMPQMVDEAKVETSVRVR